MATKRCLSERGARIMFWVSSITVAITVTLCIAFPSIYKSVLKKQLTLTDGTLLTNVWKDIPLPLYQKVYFFNITNGDAFLNHKAPLNVTEVGPYTYRGRWVKSSPQWNSNGTVSYREVRTYQFVEDMSVGTQDDVINTLNGPLIIAADKLKDYALWERIAAALVLKLESESVIISKKVRELVYEGYDDVIIKAAPLVIPDIPYKDGKFSWLWGKNATDDGIFTVYTGYDDPSKTNIITNWNGKEKMGFWNGDTCEVFNGTSVETGPTLTDPEPAPYRFFQSIFCRTLPYDYHKDNSILGINTKHFRPTHMALANSTVNPDNYCYETKGQRPSGVYTLSPCEFGSPLWASFPHFYLGDPSWMSNINGLEADPDKHESHLDVEPTTGLSVGIKVALQINIQLTNISGILQFNNILEGLYPVLWATMEAEINDDLASLLKMNLKYIQTIVYSILGVLVAVSFVLLLISLVFLYQYGRDSDENDPLIDVIEEEKSNITKRTINPRTGSINYGADGETSNST